MWRGFLRGLDCLFGGVFSSLHASGELAEAAVVLGGEVAECVQAIGGQLAMLRLVVDATREAVEFFSCLSALASLGNLINPLRNRVKFASSVRLVIFGASAECVQFVSRLRGVRGCLSSLFGQAFQARVLGLGEFFKMRAVRAAEFSETTEVVSEFVGLIPSVSCSSEGFVRDDLRVGDRT